MHELRRTHTRDATHRREHFPLVEPEPIVSPAHERNLQTTWRRHAAAEEGWRRHAGAADRPLHHSRHELPTKATESSHQPRIVLLDKLTAILVESSARRADECLFDAYAVFCWQAVCAWPLWRRRQCLLSKCDRSERHKWQSGQHASGRGDEAGRALEARAAAGFATAIQEDGERHACAIGIQPAQHAQRVPLRKQPVVQEMRNLPAAKVTRHCGKNSTLHTALARGRTCAGEHETLLARHEP
eukprot:scaffold53549_cov60-Phaeocystis_antarctica.AAC.6